MENWKNIILGVTTAISIIAILEAAGAVEIIDRDTYRLAGFCDNSDRNLSGERAEPGGGQGIAADKTKEIMQAAYTRVNEQKLNMRYEYFLSKNALDTLFKDAIATGIFIAPYFDSKDSLNLLVGASHCKKTLTEPNAGYTFVIKTFCPTLCDVIPRDTRSEFSPPLPN